MTKRKSLSKHTRFEIFKRDGFTCQYCGRTPPQVILHVDHVFPVASGGDNSDMNLVTSCEDCNQGKSDRHLDQASPSLSNQVAVAKERREQMSEFNAFLMQQRTEELEAVRELGLYWNNKFRRQKNKWVFGEARAESIRRIMKRLPLADIYDSIDIAFAKKGGFAGEEEPYGLWKYFCGICWNKVTKREEQAIDGS